MDVSLKQVLGAQNALKVLSESKLPVKAAYAVSKLLSACEAEAQHYNKQRAKLFDEAGCTIADGKYTHAEGEERVRQVLAQVDELLEASVLLNVFPLDLEQFGSAELPVTAFYGIEWAVKDPQ